MALINIDEAKKNITKKTGSWIFALIQVWIFSRKLKG